MFLGFSRGFLGFSWGFLGDSYIVFFLGVSLGFYRVLGFSIHRLFLGFSWKKTGHRGSAPPKSICHVVDVHRKTT